MRKLAVMMTVLLTIFMLLLTACGSSSTNGSSETTSSEAKEIRLGHLLDTENIAHKAALKFKEQLEKLSEGKFIIEIYPNGQLGGENEMFQQVSSNNLDMMINTPATLSGTYEAYNAWFTPYLFTDLDQVYEMAQTKEAIDVMNVIQKDNVHGLGYIITGWHNVLSKSPITNLDDFKNHKIRTLEAPPIVDWYRSIGASPTPIAFSDVYTSLQTGIIEGIDMDPTTMLGGNFYEIAGNVTLTNQFPFMENLLINKQLWDDLTSEEQEMFNQATLAMAEENLELAKKGVEIDHSSFLENGVNVIELKDSSDFQHFAQDIKDKYMKTELISDFIKKAEELK